MIARSRLTRKLAHPAWRSIWRGTGSTRSGLVRFIWATIRLVLADWLWSTAVQLARFRVPMKTFGAVLALFSIALFVWSLWGYWRGLRLLGVKRSALTVVLVLIVFVTFNVLTIPDTRPAGERVIGQTGAVVARMGRSIGEAVQSAFRAPDDFLFAFTGQRAARPLPPGVPTLDPQVTPVRVKVKPGGGGPPPALTFRVGDIVEVANTEGQALKARSKPDITGDVIARFPEDTRLTVLDGPVISNGYTWWKVSGQQGEGWCADQWLAVSN
jgi:hypothetical protein